MKTMSKVINSYSAPCLLLFGRLCEKTGSHFSDRQSAVTSTKNKSFMIHNYHKNKGTPLFSLRFHSKENKIITEQNHGKGENVDCVLHSGGLYENG